MTKTITIPETEYQFTDQTALIIVAAKQEGRLYRAANGEMELIEEFRVETPHYSDNESMPNERGNQGNQLQEKIHHEYFDHFRTRLHTLSATFKPTHLYLFAPQHVADELTKMATPLFGSVPTRDVVGIFTKESPLELIARLGK